MKLLNNLLRIILFILWAMLVLYLAKQMGISYDPEDTSNWRAFFRVLAVAIIFGGGYFIWKIKFIKKKGS
jgi:membrane protein DedA with SNARE-associated domain